MANEAISFDVDICDIHGNEVHGTVTADFLDGKITKIQWTPNVEIDDNELQCLKGLAIGLISHEA